MSSDLRARSPTHQLERLPRSHINKHNVLVWSVCDHILVRVDVDSARLFYEPPECTQSCHAEVMLWCRRATVTSLRKELLETGVEELSFCNDVLSFFWIRYDALKLWYHLVLRFGTNKRWINAVNSFVVDQLSHFFKLTQIKNDKAALFCDIFAEFKRHFCASVRAPQLFRNNAVFNDSKRERTRLLVAFDPLFELSKTASCWKTYGALKLIEIKIQLAS